MNLSYNVTGPERKKLVSAISQILNAPTAYLGAPSFKYEVGAYAIDKAGKVTGPDNLDLEDALHQAGFDADSDTREYDEPASEPEDGHQLAEVAQEAEVEAEPADEPQETESPQEAEHTPTGSIAPETPTELNVVHPLDGFTPEKFDNLCKLVTAKEALLKEALGADGLPIMWKDGGLEFPWFYNADGISAEQVEAYTALVSQLCRTALSKKRVNAKAKDTEGSPKFAMRCFLLGLGMIGPEFKNARRELTSKLSGSSSFCSKASEERWKAKHAGPKSETAEAPAAQEEPGETETE